MKHITLIKVQIPAENIPDEAKRKRFEQVLQRELNKRANTIANITAAILADEILFGVGDSTNQ